MSLNRYYSGGPVNADSALSFGGAISSEVIQNNAGSLLSSNIPGLTVIDGAGIPPGFSVKHSAGSLSVVGSDLTEGRQKAVHAPGEYLLQPASSTGWLNLSVDDSAWPIADGLQDLISLTPNNQNLFDDISETEALFGGNEFRCFYLKNDHLSRSYEFEVFFDAQAPGSFWGVGFDAGGINAEAVQPADPFTPPDGLIFKTPGRATSLKKTLQPGEYLAVWIKRTIQTNSQQNGLVVQNLIISGF